MNTESVLFKSVRDLVQVSRTEFLDKWSKDEEGKADQAMKDLLLLHRSREDISYFSGIFPTSRLYDLILPHHAEGQEDGKSPDRPIQAGGDSFQNVITNFKFYMANSRFPFCCGRVTECGSKLVLVDEIIDPAFIWITDERSIANADHGTNQSGVFIGNGLHRMISIGLRSEVELVQGFKVYFGTA